MDFSAVILAAGKGTRMKSDLPKVAHTVAGRPILQHVIDAIRGAGSSDIVLVLGFGREIIMETLPKTYPLKVAIQEQQLGTGHALMQAENQLSPEGTILVTNGDTPLLRSETLAELLKFHWASGAEATVMTAILDNPQGYGRVIRTRGGFFDRIVEEKDASSEEKQIREVNSGTYCFQTKSVFQALRDLKNDNAQHEYYLPDVLKILRRWRKPIAVYAADSAQDEVKGVNDHIQQAEAEHILRQRKNRQLMTEGVTIVDPETTYIDAQVTVERDTKILPGTFLTGNTSIGKNCLIGPYSCIADSEIADGCVIRQSWLQNVQLDAGADVGPFANLRNHTELGKNVRVGSFVEVKKSHIGDDTQVPHLSYVGDAQIGRRVNIGAGTVTCNYDGQLKHETIIADDAFIGSNTNLIAPIRVGAGAKTGAGSTLTEDVPDGALAVERAEAQLRLKNNK